MSQSSDSVANSKFAIAIAIAAAAFAIHSLEEAKSSPGIPRSNRFRKPFSNKEAKNAAGETSVRKSRGNDAKAPEGAYSTNKPIRQSSIKHASSSPDAWQKFDRYLKLKPILDWANNKKIKAEGKMGKAKLDMELARAKSMKQK